MRAGSAQALKASVRRSFRGRANDPECKGYEDTLARRRSAGSYVSRPNVRHPELAHGFNDGRDVAGRVSAEGRRAYAAPL